MPWHRRGLPLGIEQDHPDAQDDGLLGRGRVRHEQEERRENQRAEHESSCSSGLSKVNSQSPRLRARADRRALRRGPRQSSSLRPNRRAAAGNSQLLHPDWNWNSELTRSCRHVTNESRIFADDADFMTGASAQIGGLHAVVPALRAARSEDRSGITSRPVAEPACDSTPILTPGCRPARPARTTARDPRRSAIRRPKLTLTVLASGRPLAFSRKESTG